MKVTIENIELNFTGILSDSMSDAEFYNFCKQNDGQRIERDASKQIYIMAPVNSFGGKQNADLITELTLWNRKKKLGICFDSSAGFSLPDGSVLSPDASWMPNEKWNKLSKSEKEKFAAVCPNFIIELKSKSDSLKYLKNKMQNWINNGCQLAWLINPSEQKVYIYRADGSIEIINTFKTKLSGEKVLPSFELDLSILL